MGNAATWWTCPFQDERFRGHDLCGPAPKRLVPPRRRGALGADLALSTPSLPVLLGEKLRRSGFSSFVWLSGFPAAAFESRAADCAAYVPR